MQQPDYTLYSDGGASRGGVAAGACVIDGHRSGKRLGAIVFLGEATNNEAEISAALLGFSFLRLAAEKRGGSSSLSVHWVSDSEYTLKGASEYIRNWQRNGWRTASKDPVKNQGLWRAYLLLSKGFTISTEHVRGHTGHPENELCDEAATWAKENGEAALSSGSLSVEIPYAALENWFLVDGRPFIKSLREPGETEEDILSLERELREILSNRKNGAETPPDGGRTKSKKTSVAKTSAAKTSAAAEKKFGNVMATLQKALLDLEALSRDSSRAEALASGLNKLLKTQE